jgi:hypothetical protein
MIEMRNAYKNLDGNPKIKRTFVRAEHRCEDDNELYLIKEGCKDID